MRIGRVSLLAIVALGASCKSRMGVGEDARDDLARTDAAVAVSFDLTLPPAPDLALPKLTTAVWRQAFPATNPGPRSAHAMVYDSTRQRIVLFGGGDEAGTHLDDTWTYDGTTWELLPTAKKPTPRWGVVMTYDSARDRVVQFGGRVENAAGIGGTWELGTDGWSRMPIEDARYRWSAGGAFDPTRAVTVMFGGWLNGDPPDGTWEYNGTWTHRTDVAIPPVKTSSYEQLTYDSDAGRVRMLSSDVVDGQTVDIVWSYDNDAWVPLPLAVTPKNQVGAFVHVPGIGLIRVGSHQDPGEMWIYDSISAVATIQKFEPSPPAIHGHAAAFDAGRGCLVLYGGVTNLNGGDTLAETWELCP